MSFQILVATMNQKDFSKIDEMKICSDAVFANQADCNRVDETVYNGHKYIMITTDMRGVGNNRNMTIMRAEADICLLADDDMEYADGYEEKIIHEFDTHPEADVIIFNIGTSTPEYGRIPTQIKKFKRLHKWNRNPFGAPRIAFRLNSIKKKNIYFTTFFGGGCIFKAGEDTIWIEQLLNAGLKIYLSPENIGNVSYSNTTSYTEDTREKLYTKGAMLEATKDVLTLPKIMLYSFVRKTEGITKIEALKLIIAGKKGYRILQSYRQFCENK